jgi:hypothetical protein
MLPSAFGSIGFPLSIALQAVVETHYPYRLT